MLIVAYIAINLTLALMVLGVYYVADRERHTHARRLARATRAFDAMFERGAQTGDFRLSAAAARSLRRPIRLEAFYRACMGRDARTRQRLLTDNRDALVLVQRRTRSETLRAFFAYILFRMRLAPCIEGSYGPLMISFLSDRFVTVRENALKAIYSFGNAALVEEAFLSLSVRGVTHNVKLLTDGLMTFAGDRERLADRLMARYGELLDCYRDALITFMGYISCDRYDERLRGEACREGVPVDTLCCIIRKMSKTPSAANRLFLEDVLARHREGEAWEPVAVAATGLGRYTGDEEVRELLKTELVSPNWYVRKNAAASLVAVGIDDRDVAGIVGTRDRFAADAINYALWRAEHA